MTDVFLWGTRVFIPQVGRDAVLQELHGGHPGISKMKAMARMYVWWPGIIEKTVCLCGNCQEVQSSPPIAPLTHGDGQLDHGHVYM